MPDEILNRGMIEIRLGSYGVAPPTALADPQLLPAVQDYRRQAAAQMVPLERSDIQRKLPDADYFVSRKVDGEFAAIILRQGQVFSLNPGGTVRVGLPAFEEAARMLQQHGVRSAIIAAEFFVESEPRRRERVHDVVRIARQPQSAGELDSLHFAAFDLIELDGRWNPLPYSESWARLNQLLGGGRWVRPVETEQVRTAREVERLFQKHVEQDGAEGIVARSDHSGWFKIKPRHSLDAAVIGFTEAGDERVGLLHDLLLALVRGDGTLQVLCRVGGGFSEDQRRDWLSDLKDSVVDSEYAEVNSDHVAYRMVRPDWVVEISCLDLVSQTTRGAPVNRMTLNWNRQRDAYEVIRRLPLVSVISPQFLRRREDKRVNPDDVRVRQVADIVDIPLVHSNASQMVLPKSQPIRRRVYTKTLKGETMVRKFLMWRTNKEADSEHFPAYVVHFTDYSPNRQVPLAREVRVSNSLDQIQALWSKLVEENVKQGWSLAAETDGNKD
jgi:ATP-dependent DNA ligase